MEDTLAGGPRISPTRILAGLILGLVIGLALKWAAPAITPTVEAVINPIGQLWLRALQMTIIPLVVSLLITGIITSVAAARAGRIAAWSLGIFIAFLWASTMMSAFLTPALLSLFPIPADAAQALTTQGSATAATGDVPTLTDFVLGIIPTNPFAAAANASMLPLIVFAGAFGFAIAKLDPTRRDRLGGIFEATTQAMLIIIGWVLALAPIGVAALAFSMAVGIGVNAIGVLLHYILIVVAVGGVVLLAAYPVAMIGGRLNLLRYARTVMEPQTVALSTQSSLASLPAMLRACVSLGVRTRTAEVTLPLAVAVYRATSPAMNLAVVIYVAHLTGTPITPTTMALGIAVAATTTMGSVSLPGTVSFVASCGPIALAMGVPVGPLALLVAVETLPDIMRTVGNVTMNVAVTATVDRLAGGAGADDALPEG